jgi:uncharacterized protein YbcV (DUF1398 family)
MSSENNVIVSEEFVSDLKEFIDLCEQIHTAKDEIKLLNERKSELEKKMETFMVQNNITGFSTPSGKVSIQSRKSVKPLNKDYLSEVISTRIHDKSVVEEIVQKTFSERPSTMKPKIKITQNQG